MIKMIYLICGTFLYCLSGSAQQIAPVGFDVKRQLLSQGKIDSISYPSKTVGVDRKALIYTPPGYSKSKKYPVLYLLHGIGGDEKEWYRHGTPHIILDNLYAEGKLEDMIVVLPNGRAMKDDRATGNIMAPDKVEAFSTFEQDLLNDLIPFVEKKYPIKKDREHRAIFGLSMGGGQALNFGLGNLDQFAWVGGFSSAPNTRMPEQLLPNPQEAKQKLKLLWVSCGDQDGLMGNSQRTHEYLKQHNVPHVFYVEPGGHDFKVWKNDLYMVSQLLFKPVNYGVLKDLSPLGFPAETNIRRAKYPQVLADSRVRFQIDAPEAQRVQVPHGEIRIKRYFSSVARSWRQCRVYVPAGYDQSDLTYPVLYLLHGGGEDETGWASQGKADLILDNLIADKKAKPMIIVMIDGNMGGEAFSEAPLRNFDRELKEVVIPFTEANFRTKKDPGSRALAGLSMGGIQTLYAGIKDSQLFAHLGVFSSGWFANQTELTDTQYAYMKQNKDKINQNLKSLWVAMGGKEDIAYNNCKVMLSKFDEIGVKYTYSEYPGGHTWPVWRNNLYNFTQLLFN